jgi:hypothetical protein
MKKYLLAAVAALAISSTATNAGSDGGDWILLCVGATNSVGYFIYDDVRADLGLRGEERYPPSFSSKRACLIAERRLVQKYAGLSHAEGGDHTYLCTQPSNWD